MAAVEGAKPVTQEKIEMTNELSKDEMRLIEKHHKFYLRLSSGKRRPSTPEQVHFVEVCRGEKAPETVHEIAWKKWRSDFKFNRVCASCGKIILKARMKRFPYAKVCVPCKEAKANPTVTAIGPNLGKCPKCGWKLVWRESRSYRAGESFLGCSNYPKCRFKKTGSSALD
jgi:ssDNA-binding Zn-finger/Zn-ribbon topoisomerase 1